MVLELVQGDESLDTNDYDTFLVERGYDCLEPQLKQDIIAVLSFFCRETLVYQGLKKFATDYFQFGSKGHKTMRQFFDSWGSQNGFNAPNTDKAPSGYTLSSSFQYPHATPILFGELSADLFLNVLLKNGYLSSDPGAGVEHGKWAHSIQIYLLEEARKEGVLKLNSSSVCEFIKIISQIPPVFESQRLWDVLFDSFDDCVFTCPNTITSHLHDALDSSQASQQLTEKFIAHKEKVKQKGYGIYSQKKYESRISQSTYVRYGDKYGIMWFQENNETKEKKTAPGVEGASVDTVDYSFDH